MARDLDDLSIFVAVVRAGGFRDAARAGSASASSLSDAMRRLETRLGVRLLHRNTRSVTPTEAGRRLFDRLAPALIEVEASLDEVNAFRDRPAGTLKLNVPANVARGVLPSIVTPFLKAYPDIRLEVTVEDGFIDVVARGFDAGIRYDERLAQDMIALPIGPRVQRMITAAAPAYLNARGRPSHPLDLLAHACLRGRFAGGAAPHWEFERDGETVQLDPPGPLSAQPGLAIELVVDAAVAGLGIVYLFEDWLAPHLASGALEPILQPWSPSFPGPFLYYPGRRHLPAPLRAFVDFVRKAGTWD
ncbi:LysR family transcriptional regulator [Ancylobacter defluvii]|uniref:LysR family transcriptional regulator n=1 Tax=Ancylobacter defluvii TaxID=1282440 RepID=A0A9W6NCU8_9HYPH|nr:LysR family transcriptional regulator [Ancylobacter defluvii]MBS7588814.1 LysR family transcriptional regulator [Ancylobacter defluvii]GLK86904.1 LysR family transcriptional regulator [Ancylobacter defluvii]